MSHGLDRLRELTASISELVIRLNLYRGDQLPPTKVGGLPFQFTGYGPAHKGNGGALGWLIATYPKVSGLVP